MYLNSQSYEKKYRKYKNKYQILKSHIGDDKGTLLNGGAKGTLLNGGAKGTLLNGGECDSLPNAEEEDYNLQNLLDLCPDAKGTFWRKNYNSK